MALKNGGGVRWIRSNGRLTRVKIEEVDDDVEVIGVENEEAIRKLVVQKTVRRKSIVLRRKKEQDWAFLKLPSELQLMILDHISTQDVSNLGKTCKAMEEFVNNNFVASVIVPLSDENQKRLAGRYVLDLTSTVDIRVWRLGAFFDMIRNMNLTKLKRLKFNGPNFIFKEGRFYALNSSYLHSLAHIIGDCKNLQSVDILIDKSFRLGQIINTISGFPRLKEVTLRSSGLNGRIFETDPKENPSMTLNKLLERLLKNEVIEKLTLIGFSVPWDFHHQSSEKTYRVFIKSKSLQSLSIECTKSFKIGNIEAENLKEIVMDHDDLYHDDTLASRLAVGCPRLERLDINSKSSDLGVSEWVSNHKGEGSTFISRH